MKMIKLIRDYLNDNVGHGKRITLERVSKETGVKKFRLCHSLSINGLKFIDIRSYYEMESAASLFESGKTRDEVASIIGYTHVCGLDYAFRKNFGVSTKKYLEQHLNITFKVKYGHHQEKAVTYLENKK